MTTTPVLRTGRTAIGGAAAIVAMTIAMTSCSASKPAPAPPAATPSNSGSAATPSAVKTQLFSDDFRGVCQGATVSRATPYAAGSPHKVVLFSPYTGSLVEDTTTLPDDWTVQFDANTDNYAKVDTVTCINVKDEQPLKECTGYQDDKGHDTGNKVDLRTATYTVTVHEATTGKVLGTTELVGTDDSCPMFVFDNDTQSKTYDSPPPKDALIAFLKPFVQP